MMIMTPDDNTLDMARSFVVEAMANGDAFEFDYNDIYDQLVGLLGDDEIEDISESIIICVMEEMGMDHEAALEFCGF